MRLKRWLAAGLAALTAVSVGACKGGGQPSGDGAEVWFAPSTDKIMLDGEYTDRNTTALELSMARNEYELGQIILTANEDLDSYSVTVSDLIGPGDEIPASDISLYNLGYLDGSKERSETEYAREGMFPDIMVPFDKAAEYGETTAQRGQNKSIAVKVKTTKDTKPGEYTGTFTVTAEEHTYTAPVKVTVWDYEVPDTVSTASTFLMYYDPLLFGEGDNTPQMQKLYYDYFLENRISLMYLPTYPNDLNGYIELLREYWDNPKFSAYGIPYGFTTYYDSSNELLQYGYESPNLTELETTIKRIVAASVDDKTDYLSKAYIYNIFIDEYSYDAGGIKQAMAEKWRTSFPQLLETIENDFDVAYGTAYLDSVPGLRFSLQTVSNMQVGNHVAGVSSGFNTICPEFHIFNSAETLAQYKEIYSNPGDEVWWYGCVHPANPYPTYHTCDPNSWLSARVVSWMQYEYDIFGNLYFSVNAWHDGDTRPIDPYVDQFYLLQGDGTLVYPGARYGIRGPVGSMRMEAIRDGLEEYEVLTHLEDTVYAGLSEYYDIDLDVRASLASMFDSIYAGTVCTQDSDDFVEARGMLTQAVLLAQSDAKIVPQETAIGLDTATVTVLAAEDCEITPAEGITVTSEPCGQGTRYTFTLTRGESDLYLNFTAKLGDETIEYSQFIERGVKPLVGFGSESDLAHLSVSNGLTLSSGTIAGVTGAKITVGLPGDGSVTSVIINRSAWSGIDTPTSLSFGLYNDTDADIEVEVRRRTSAVETVLVTVTLKSRQWTNVTVNDMTNFDSWQGLGIYMPTEGLSSGETYDLYLADLSYSA